MQITVNVNKDEVGCSKPRNPRHYHIARAFRRLGKRIRTLLPTLLICLLATAAVALAQQPPKTAVGQSDAQKAFAKLKTLAGSWEGPVTSFPEQAMMAGKLAQISLRVTSTGNALMHELTMNGMPDDPITMFYVDEDRLLLTHYCDAGNRPRMVGKLSADGKTLEFDFIDISGSTKYGHMHHAVFTIIDENHHTEDWTYMLPGDKPVRAHFDLQRKK